MKRCIADGIAKPDCIDVLNFCVLTYSVLWTIVVPQLFSRNVVAKLLAARL